MDQKNTYTEVFLKAADLPCDEDSVKKIKNVWWYSTREKDEGGLRFTDECLEFLEKRAEIKTYKIELPKDLIVSSQVLIWLDHYITTPFHLQKKYITVLSEKTAFELYLFSGDVRKMGAAKAMNKRINQD